jgi:hypothetical protein
MRSKSALIAMLMALAAAPAVSAQTIAVREEKPGLLKMAKITSDAAIATAQAKLPNAKLKSAEIEQEDGKLLYSLDFVTAGKTGIDEVNVDAITGKQVGKIEHESPAQQAKEAAEDSAKAAKAKKP